MLTRRHKQHKKQSKKSDTTTGALPSLPAEIWNEILGNFNKKELRDVSVVSKSLRLQALSVLVKAPWPAVDYRKLLFAYKFEDVLLKERSDLGTRVVNLFVLTNGDVVLGFPNGTFYLKTVGLRKSSAFSGHTAKINHVLLVDAERLVSASADGTMRIWDRSTTALLQEFPKINSYSTAEQLILLSNGNLICYDGPASGLHLWRKTPDGYVYDKALLESHSVFGKKVVSLIQLENDAIVEYPHAIVRWHGQSGKWGNLIQKNKLEAKIKLIINSKLRDDQFVAEYFPSSDNDIMTESEDYTEPPTRIELDFDWKLSSGFVIVTANKYYHFLLDLKCDEATPVFIGTILTLKDIAAHNGNITILQRISSGYSILTGWDSLNNKFNQHVACVSKSPPFGGNVIDDGVVLLKHKETFHVTLFNSYTREALPLTLAAPFKERYLNQACYKSSPIKKLNNGELLMYTNSNDIIIWNGMTGDLLLHNVSSEWIDKKFKLTQLANGDLFGYSTNHDNQASLGGAWNVGVLHFGLFRPEVDKAIIIEKADTNNKHKLSK